MTRKDFNKLMERQWEQIKELNRSKGKDYAGDFDALLNFKREALALGLTPYQVWGVYAAKHWGAVMSFCKQGQVESEPIESRIQDMIVYMFLLKGLIEDTENNTDERPF